VVEQVLLEVHAFLRQHRPGRVSGRGRLGRTGLRRGGDARPDRRRRLGAAPRRVLPPLAAPAARRRSSVFCCVRRRFNFICARYYILRRASLGSRAERSNGAVATRRAVAPCAPSTSVAPSYLGVGRRLKKTEKRGVIERCLFARLRSNLARG
jgi:hypothetical protein